MFLGANVAKRALVLTCSAPRGRGGGGYTNGPVIRWHAAPRRHTSDAVNTQYTTGAPLATLAFRNTGASTLQKHNNKSDTTNARQYMKDTDAYYKRELMTLTKGEEKVVYLPGEKCL